MHFSKSAHWSSAVLARPNSVTASWAKVRKRVVVDLVERHAEHPAARQQPGLEQVEQAGEQLAARQVAGRPEQEDDVRVGRRDQAGVDVVRIARSHAPTSVQGRGFLRVSPAGPADDRSLSGPGASGERSRPGWYVAPAPSGEGATGGHHVRRRRRARAGRGGRGAHRLRPPVVPRRPRRAWPPTWARPGSTPSARPPSTRTVRQSLQNRLRVTEWHRASPAAADRAPDVPIIVVGLTRTGTTALSHLLAADPANRSLRRWEAQDSVPPPTEAGYWTDPRYVAARDGGNMLDLINPRFKAIHHDEPEDAVECAIPLGQHFTSIALDSMFNIDGYGDWLYAADLTHAYDYHRQVLQVLGSDYGGPVAAEVTGARLRHGDRRRRLPRRRVRADPPRPGPVHRLDPQPQRVPVGHLHRRRLPRPHRPGLARLADDDGRAHHRRSATPTATTASSTSATRTCSPTPWPASAGSTSGSAGSSPPRPRRR